jgi:hypothetical protein
VTTGTTLSANGAAEATTTTAAKCERCRRGDDEDDV